jgi:DNA polymerase III gamma/tau subunit
MHSGILQKVLAVSQGKKISQADVEMVSGAPKGELVRQIVRALAEKNADAGLQAIQSAIAENTDARVLAKLLIHFMRAVLLIRFAPDLAEKMTKELGEADLALAKEISKNPGVTSDTLRCLLEAHSQMAYAAVPHLPLELAVIDICQTNAKS